ncbi:FAD synthetase family protein [Camelliibacillus cellulosilyticus]|uniref:Riboflavin biosynthesis protein n=1 Tax=Camelliibacillus cellulosilyticus TaxID=2174486 RepID=A0ABV9GI69_9BACL
MEIIEVICEPEQSLETQVLCIGKFDGVHIGHQHLLKTARAYVGENDKLSVMSFSPHPIWALTGNPKYKYSITPLKEKIKQLALYGVTRLYRVHFTKDYAKTDVEPFVFDHLSKLKLKRLVVGEGFNFGKTYDSGTDVLTKLCAVIGVPVTVVPILEDHGHKISSTDIRQFIALGQLDQAENLLGRPYKITGTYRKEDGQELLVFSDDGSEDGDDYILPKEGIFEMRFESTDGQVFNGKGFFQSENRRRFAIQIDGFKDPQALIAGNKVSATFLHRIDR